MVDGVVAIPLPGPAMHAPAIPVAAGPRLFAAEKRGATATRDFIAGPENRLVETVVRAVLDRPTNGYNPLVIYGPSGTGKSHLAHGLAAAWKTDVSGTLRNVGGTRRVPNAGSPTARSGDRPEQFDRSEQWRLLPPEGGTTSGPHAERAEYSKVVTTTAVDFARELADAIETQGVDEFRAKHRGAGLLVVEDIGQLATPRSGKLSAQEELVHTLDALVAEGRWAIVTASAAPWELLGIVPMLQSRLMAGLAIRLAPPGPEARLTLLQQLAGQREIDLPAAAAQVLAEGLTGTVPELAGALWELAMGEKAAVSPHADGEHSARCGATCRRPLNRSGRPRHDVSLAHTRRLDPAAARQYLARRSRRPKPGLHEIALATARHFSLRLADLRSPVRSRALVAARGVAAYLARHLAGQSLEEIGRYFGGRDHTTVMHSYRRTEELITTDPMIREAVEQLQASLSKA